MAATSYNRSSQQTGFMNESDMLSVCDDQCCGTAGDCWSCALLGTVRAKRSCPCGYVLLLLLPSRPEEVLEHHRTLLLQAAAPHLDVRVEWVRAGRLDRLCCR
jgi:hypothetical protein